MDIKNWKTEWNFLSKEDLRMIRGLSSYEVKRIGGEALEALLRIEAILRKLRPMGEDELRQLWLPVMGKNIEWLQVSSSQYTDHHYLQFCLQETHFVTLSNVTNRPDNSMSGIDALPLLTAVEKYVSEVVRFIEEDADCYNQYVEKNLNPVFRTGKVSRKTWLKYCPEDIFSEIDKKAAITLFKNPPTPHLFDKMTLRRYQQVRRIANDAVYGQTEGTDAEVLQHMPGMQDLSGYDMDSPKDFERWERTIRGFHGMDVVYARVHLSPKEVDGGVNLDLWVSTVGHLSSYIKTALGLTAAGFPPFLTNAEEILSLLEERDIIRVKPQPSYYLSHGETLTEHRLPDRSELGIKAFNALVKEIQWDPLKEVLSV